MIKKNNYKIRLSVIIPVFNEEKNIKNLIERCQKINSNKYIEFLLVEDTGSTDNTRKEILKYSKKNPFIRPIFTDKKGYGISIYNGLKVAKGEYLSWTHGDIQTDPNDLLTALNLLSKEKNPKNCFVKGERKKRPLFDQIFTSGMSFFESVLFRKKLYDINAQPNVFHKNFLKHLRNPPSDFSFDLYAYYIALRNEYKIIRFPVYFGKRLHGKSAWNTGIKSKIKFIKRTIKFSLELKKKLN